MRYRNAEGYLDPTAGAAIARAIREDRRRAKRKAVYICSRYAGDIKANVRAARKYCRFAVENGAAPVAPHLLFPQFMDDNDPAERRIALSLGRLLMDRCDEVWVFSDGELSAGMRSERDYAARKGYGIRYFTENCHKAPAPLEGRQL